MAISTRQEGLITKKEITGLVGGFALSLIGLVEMSNNTSRIQTRVDTDFPPIFNAETVSESRSILNEYGLNNCQAIERGDLIIAVPPEVSARLRFACGVQAQESEHLKKRSDLTSQLYTEAQEVTLDLSDFNKGRFARGIMMGYGGVGTMTLAVLSMFRRIRQR